MDENKIISLENLNQYSGETSEKIKSYVNTKTSVVQDGTKTVGGVSSDDYNAFKSAVEDSHTHSNMSVLDEIDESVVKGGNSLSGSSSYTITDSVEYPIVGLKVYGKSTQDGTPTPENPVEIVSVENPTVTVCGKNLLNVTLQTTTQNGITCTNNGDGTYTLNGTTTADTDFNLSSTFKLESGTYKILGITDENTTESRFWMEILIVKNGYAIDNNNSITNNKNGSVFYNKNEQIVNCVVRIQPNATLNNVILKPFLTKDLTATYDDFEPYIANTLTLSHTLNAIPVSSGGNVTIDGQEYIADYKDYGTGKYHRLVDPDKLDPTVSIVDNLDLQLASEEITDIPETEMQAYRQLQTYNGTTNISNDKGAGMSVEYCTSKMLAEYALPLIQNLENENSLNEKVKFLNNMQRTGKVYTVRFPLWETSQTCNGEKLDDNAGLVCNPSTATTRGVSDYDNIPLFITYDCNAYVDEDGLRHITAIKGDENYRDTGKVDVFVLGTSYYEKSWVEDGYMYYSCTDLPRDGYVLASECKTKDGKDQGFALYPKCFAGDIDGKPYGSFGLVPARYCSGRPAGSQNISYSGNISYFHQRGSHYSGTFASEIKYITTRWWLKYGTRNSQSVMAGCTDYNVQYVATVAETGVKRIIISNANAAYFEVGMPVSIGDNGNSAPDRNVWACHNKAESATITAIEAYDDNDKAIYVDVDTAFDTTTSTYIATFLWRSGFSNKVLGRDGSPCSASAGLTNGKYPAVIQGIECFVGLLDTISNAMSDIVDSTGKRDMYIVNDSTKLTADIATAKSTYSKIAEQITPTSLNAWNYNTAVGCNVENGIIVPTAAGQSGSSSTTGYADGLYCDGASAGQRELLCFGFLGNGSLGGVSCLFSSDGLGNANWGFGARNSING